jgi:hypothetical protein
LRALQLPFVPIILFWLHARLAWCNDAIRVDRSLDLFVEPLEDAIGEGVCIHDLIHDNKVRAILSPALFCTIIGKRLNQPKCFLLLFFVFAVKRDAHNVVHLTHADRESTDEVQASFFASRLGDSKLGGSRSMVGLLDGRPPFAVGVEVRPSLFALSRR